MLCKAVESLFKILISIKTSKYLPLFACNSLISIILLIEKIKNTTSIHKI